MSVLASDQKSVAMDLERLMRPRSIAVAGASPDPASFGGAVLRNIASAGFKGDLHLVSPTRKEINGIPCMPSLNELPFGVDAAVLNIPRAALRDAVTACVKRGVGSAVVFAAGFAEAGEAGARRTERNCRHLPRWRSCTARPQLPRTGELRRQRSAHL